MVDYEQRGRVAVFTIRRPEARNAVNGEVAQALEAAVDRFEADDDAWAAVLAGEGPVFSAGADLKAVAASAVRRTVQPAGLPAEPSEEFLATARRAATRVPGIAKLLGIEPEEGSTPPPREKPSGSRRRDRRPPRPRAGVPPPTPRPESPVDTAAEHRQPTPPVSELSAGIAAWILDGETEETG